MPQQSVIPPAEHASAASDSASWPYKHSTAASASYKPPCRLDACRPCSSTSGASDTTSSHLQLRSSHSSDQQQQQQSHRMQGPHIQPRQPRQPEAGPPLQLRLTPPVHLPPTITWRQVLPASTNLAWTQSKQRLCLCLALGLGLQAGLVQCNGAVIGCGCCWTEWLPSCCTADMQAACSHDCGCIPASCS